MPVKELKEKLKEVRFSFEYEDVEYTFENYMITDFYGNCICMCDFTGTKYYGDEALMEFVAKMCLQAFFKGSEEGQKYGEEKIQSQFRILLGVN